MLMLWMLVPISTLIFNLWHCASHHHEIMQERLQMYRTMNYLEAVISVVIQQLKKQHEIVWSNLDYVRQPLVLPAVLSIVKDSQPTFRFHIVLDKPSLCHAQQLRLCVQLLTNTGRVQRSVSCLLTREVKSINQKERYVFMVDYYTFSGTI